MRKSQADTWIETPGRYIRFYDKQNEVRFTHYKTFDQKIAFLVTIQLHISLNIDLTAFCDEKCLVFPVQ